jgi:phage-related protein
LISIVNDKCYPFTSGVTGVADECKINTNVNRVYCPSTNQIYNGPMFSSSPAYPIRVESANDIMEEIINNGPVQVIFKVFDDFFMYKTGVYVRSRDAKVLDVENPYHSAKILGWGTDYNIDYWVK